MKCMKLCSYKLKKEKENIFLEVSCYTNLCNSFSSIPNIRHR